jgi:hypothetical protein
MGVERENVTLLEALNTFIADHRDSLDAILADYNVPRADRRRRGAVAEGRLEMLESWKPDLLMAVPLAASFVMYGVGGSRVRVPTREVAAFLTGWVILVVALLSPIATMSEWLFSGAHDATRVADARGRTAHHARPATGPDAVGAASSLEHAAQRRRRLVANVGQFIEDRRLIQRREVPDP